MANEITLNNSIDLQNGSIAQSFSSSSQVSQTTARYDGGVQTIGTTHEQIVIKSDITTPGIAGFRNLGATNYIEIGIVVSSTFYPVMKLKPGESALLRLSSNALYAKANTAASDISFLILAD